LDAARVDVLADVRAHPGSRRSPQFGSTEMARWLPEHGIEYRHLPGLAGRRGRQPGIDPAVNAGWQNDSFRNYADYTLTEEFARGLAQLTGLATRHRVAVMCGEPMPWRCHRLLIANTLTARGWTVRHLVAGGPTRTHVLGQWGASPAVDGGRVTYPVQPSPGSAPPSA
jgi:uncharacterized protein (DUF488 family)